MKPIQLLFKIMLCVWFFSGIASADAPQYLLRQTIDDVLIVLKDEDLKAPEKKSLRRKKLREIVDKRFDFEEMAKRALAVYWRKRTDSEKKEFTSLFSDLLEKTYVDKIEKYTDEEVLYLGERVKGEYSIVKTELQTKKFNKIPMDYRMIKKEDEWRVYDIVIEGVSLVNNYRTQFRTIIRRESYKELIRRLKEKQTQ